LHLDLSFELDWLTESNGSWTPHIQFWRSVTTGLLFVQKFVTSFNLNNRCL